MWNLVVEVCLGAKCRPPVAVRDAVTVGRYKFAALRVDLPTVSETQCQLVSADVGWVITNGPRTPMKVTGPLVEAVVQPGGQVLLTAGAHTVRWPELGADLRLKVRVTGKVGPEVAGVIKDPKPVTMRPRHTTQFPLDVVGRSQRQAGERSRHRLAVMFKHLILGGEEPTSIYRAALESLAGEGDRVTGDALRQLVRQETRRVLEAGGPRLDVRGLGTFLVTTTNSLGELDLAVPRTASRSVPRPHSREV